MSLYKTKSKCNDGFTLIELLVVVAIIGLLSSVVFSSLSTARSKARDAQRTASIRQVQNALELYYDTTGSYISSLDVVLDVALTPLLTPTYISKIATSPSGLSYRYYNAGQGPATYYAIYIGYENKAPCYVCAGSVCQAGNNWWGVDICR